MPRANLVAYEDSFPLEERLFFSSSSYSPCIIGLGYLASKPHTTSHSEQVNNFICAELSDLVLNADNALRVVIELTIMHNSCDASDFTASCIISVKRDSAKVCNKNFLKTFQEEIEITQDNYSLYCRRNNKRIFTRRKRDRDITFDNR
jgi:hypothetical protein